MQITIFLWGITCGFEGYIKKNQDCLISSISKNVVSVFPLEIKDNKFFWSFCKQDQLIELDDFFTWCLNIINNDIEEYWAKEEEDSYDSIKKEIEISLQESHSNGMYKCPICNSKNTRTFCDGTAYCNECGNDFRYWCL